MYESSLYKFYYHSLNPIAYFFYKSNFALIFTTRPAQNRRKVETETLPKIVLANKSRTSIFNSGNDRDPNCTFMVCVSVPRTRVSVSFLGEFLFYFAASPASTHASPPPYFLAKNSPQAHDA